MRFPIAVSACLTVMFMLPAAAFAQASSPHAKVLTEQYRVETRQVQPETYGTASKSWYVLGARDFSPIDSTVTFSGVATNIYRTGGDSFYFEGIIKLPEGALLTDIQYQLCDSNAGFDIGGNLWTKSASGSFAYITIGPVTSGSAGCGLFSQTFTPPVQIDNNGFTYGLELYLPVADPTMQVTAARVGYKLQISPDPPGATFADVPVGSNYHRFVEALVAAGITGGCGGGNYCPDAPVTRGQMAVFLAGALGLHWAP